MITTTCTYAEPDTLKKESSRNIDSSLSRSLFHKDKRNKNDLITLAIIGIAKGLTGAIHAGFPVPTLLSEYTCAILAVCAGYNRSACGNALPFEKDLRCSV